jgi:elongation factor P--beta-lysine ligase
MLRLRAQMIQQIRQFFLKKAVLEVETPLLSHAVGTDPQLAFFTTRYCATPIEQTLFLQTSPEAAGLSSRFVKHLETGNQVDFITLNLLYWNGIVSALIYLR